VLLIAEMCNPEWVSVPLVGWSHARALSRIADVHLVTRSYNRPNILKHGLREGADFTAVGSGPVEDAVTRLGRLLRGGDTVGWTIATAFSSFTYYGFEARAWRLLGTRIRGGEFDLVHRLTPVSPAVPSPIAPRCRRAGVPFVVGPLNGGVPWPPGFEYARQGEREWMSLLRPAHRLLPGYRATRRCASAILVGSRVTRAEIPARDADRCVYVPENGFEPSRFGRSVSGEVRLPIRVAFAGRHVRLKGIDLLIRAAAPLVRDGSVVLDLIGDGPETPRLKEMARSEGIVDGVEFPGWVSHEKLQDRLVRSDVFGFPSVRDFGGGVVIEAMALGLVPVVLDYGGPGEIVSPRTGFAVPMGGPPQVIEGLRSALSRLASDPTAIRPMGERAKRRVLSLFTWDAKAAQVLAVYQWVRGLAPVRPDFGTPFADPDWGPSVSP
jgi:glycosyltransferase involved in cell wall biosynthesis